MVRVFIFHSSRDNADAAALFSWLKAQGLDLGFLDIDKHAGIPTGANWEQTLYDELERAQAVILLPTKNWFASKCCFAEFTHARPRGKAIFPWWSGPMAVHPISASWSSMNPIQQFTLALRRSTFRAGRARHR